MNIVRSSAFHRCLAAFALSTLAASCNSEATANAAPDETSALTHGHAKPNILLVHGAFAGALAWQKVTTLLQQRGYTVVAVENTLTGLDDDVATTKRAIAKLAATGPMVVVGHSYGGMVITGAAVDTPQVKALVYINAFAPDPGVSAGYILQTGPPVLLGQALLPPDAAGFLFVDTAKFRAAFCADAPIDEANVAAVSQKPIAGSAFAASLTVAAWQTIPSWYMVGTQDQAIPAESERAMAKHIGAHTVEIDSSHTPFISHPHAVARLIEEAARSVR
jgi:pimeloyl-ACP methyl ester carboxylesterase